MAAGPPARGWSRRSGFGRLPSGHRTAVSERLVADVGQIRSSASTVKAIRDAVTDSDALIDRYADAVGQSVLVDALHDFASNWKIHREKLVKDLDTFSGWAGRAADEYDRADHDLGAALTRTAPAGETES